MDSADRCVPCSEDACAEPLEIQYLGSAGFWIRRGPDELLLAPFFSHQGVFRVAARKIRSDETLVRRWMPFRPGVRAILVGHGHYDHLMDVPAVIEWRTPHAIIYASESSANILAAVDPPLRVVALDSDAAEGRPVPLEGLSVRVLPILSDHAPHFAGIKLMGGRYTDAQTELPTRSFGWREGQTLAFVIDFVEPDGSVAFRLHHQDAATNPPAGFPPPAKALGPADYRIAIPCVGAFRQVDDYPEKVLEAFGPDFVVLSHWEDFFRPYTRSTADLRELRLTDTAGFIAEIPEDLRNSVVLPAPGMTVRFAQACP